MIWIRDTTNVRTRNYLPDYRRTFANKSLRIDEKVVDLPTRFSAFWFDVRSGIAGDDLQYSF